MFGTILENVVLDPDTREGASSPTSRSPRTRAPRTRSTTSATTCRAGAADTPSTSSSSPPTPSACCRRSRSSRREQAMYYFLSGYTAKVAGTERGVTEPQATFSACFGAVFLVWHPTKYAEMLGELLDEARRAGLAGEHRLERRRLRRRHAHEARATRARWCARPLAGELDGAPTATRPDLRAAHARPPCRACPTRCSTRGDTWSDRAAYDAQADEAGRRCSARTSRSSASAVDSRPRSVGVAPARQRAARSARRRAPHTSAHTSRLRDILRDPLWNNIRLDALGAARCSTPRSFQRLRYVRQLGLAYLVYPGRHALALRARARRVPPRRRDAARCSTSRGSSASVPPDEPAIVRGRRAAARHRTLPLLARARGDRRAPPRGGRPAAAPRGGGRRGAARATSAPTRPSACSRSSRGTSDSPAAGTDLRLARPRQDRVPQARRAHVRRAVRRDRRGSPAQLPRARATRPRAPGTAASAWACARRGSQRSSRCSSPSTRCTATCTGTTRCAAPRRCTSGSWPRRCAPDWSRRRSVARFTDEGLLHHLDALPLPPVAARCSTTCVAAGCTSARSNVRRRARRRHRASGWPTDYALTRRAEDALALELGLAPGALLLDYPREDPDARARPAAGAPRRHRASS